MAYPTAAPRINRKSTVTYSENVVKRMYQAGMSDNMNYYLAVFHLGRYLKYSVGLDEVPALIEMTTWLQRHFVDICKAQGLTPFVGAFTNKINVPYRECEVKAIRSFRNGFRTGKPFKQWVKIHRRRTSSYLHKLAYNERQTTALLNLLDYAIRHKTLDLYLSYPKLLTIFNLPNRNTLSKWLKRFNEDGIFTPQNRDTRPAKQPMQYLLHLPQTCYRIL